MPPSELVTRPVCDALGLEVLDFDASAPVDERGRAALEAALDAHQLLLFRDQKLDADAQVCFLEHFGPALIENETGQRYQHVSHTREDGILGDGRFAFHSDHAFMDEPIELIALYGAEVPPGCGETRFVNALAAARTLPETLRARVEGRMARHIIDPRSDSGATALSSGPHEDRLPHAIHPILWPHPRTQEPILYVSEQQSDRIESLDAEESRSILEALFAHLYSPEFGYVHSWREGDLIVWDNRALQHARDALEAKTPRSLRRVSVGGTSVIEYFRGYEDKYGRLTAAEEPAGS